MYIYNKNSLRIQTRFNLKKDLKSCEFRNLTELEAKDIATKLKRNMVICNKIIFL